MSSLSPLRNFLKKTGQSCRTNAKRIRINGDEGTFKKFPILPYRTSNPLKQIFPSLKEKNRDIFRKLSQYPQELIIFARKA